MKKRYIIALIISLILLGLTYKFWLIFKTATSARFDFYPFCIILVLSYLGGLKLTDYLADFKDIKHQSRIEIVFLLIFFMLLFLPMSHINQDEKSEKENRMLAPYKPLISTDGKINYNFGIDFNNWYNDRFCLRQTLIDINNLISQSITNKFSKGFWDAKNKIFYNDWENIYYDIDKIRTNFQALYQFDEFCKQNNIKLYILIVPEKGHIYKTKMNAVNNSNKEQDFLRYIDLINKENQIKVISTYTAMDNAKYNGELLYFRTEHHWTDTGAFIGYKELMKEIKKDYPDINILDEKDFTYFYDKKIRGDFNREFHYGQSCKYAGVPDAICKEYHKYDYRYFTHKNHAELEETIINEPFHLEKIYKYNKGANYRVIQLGTSQNENLTEFIPYTFKNVKRIRNNTVQQIRTEDEFKIMKYYKKEILDYKPDIIIFCITYTNMNRLQDLFNME